MHGFLDGEDGWSTIRCGIQHDNHSQGLADNALHGLLETFLVDRQFNCNVRETPVDVLVRTGFDSGVVPGVLMILSDGAEAEQE